MKIKSLKNNWIRFTLAVIFTGVLATAARAESFSVQVPFAFEAAGKSFPAGTYTVEAAAGGVVTIRGATSIDTGAMIALPALYSDTLKPSLVFEKRPDLAVLSSVNLPSGIELTIAPVKRLTATVTLPPKGSMMLSHP